MSITPFFCLISPRFISTLSLKNTNNDNINFVSSTNICFSIFRRYWSMFFTLSPTTTITNSYSWILITKISTTTNAARCNSIYILILIFLPYNIWTYINSNTMYINSFMNTIDINTNTMCSRMIFNNFRYYLRRCCCCWWWCCE